MILGSITARERKIHTTKVSSAYFFIDYTVRLKIEEMIDAISSLQSLTELQALYSVCDVQNHICLLSSVNNCNSILLFRLTAAGKAIRFLSKSPQLVTTLLKV